MCQEARQPVKTFSMGFKDEAFNELPYAREVAEQLHTDHHEFVVEPSAVEILPTLVRVYDEPYADPSAIPTYYVSQFSREFVTVVLNGDGGDELLGGYARYRFGALHSLLMNALELHQGTKVVTDCVADWLTGLVPSSDGIRTKQSRLTRLLQPLSQQYLGRVSYFTPAQKAWLYTPEFNKTVRAHNSRDVMARWFDEAQAMTQLDRLLSVDTHSYLPDDLLVKVDRATMAHGLEARSPLLDHKVVEFAAALPIRQKVRNGETKYVLREAMRGTLPDPVLTREKKGFAVPIDRWFREECRELLRESLLNTRATERGYFQPTHIQNLIHEHEQGKANHGARLYALLMLELWHREYVDKRACVT